MFRFWKLPILVARPWRLAPELDGFDDRVCEIFCEDLLWVRRVGLVLAVAIAIVVGAGLTAAVSAAGLAIEDHFRRSTITSSDTVSGRVIGLAAACFVIMVTVSVAFTPYCMLLRRAIHRHLSRVACPVCRYSLV